VKSALSENPARTIGVVLLFVVLITALFGIYADNRRQADRITVIETNITAQAMPFAPFDTPWPTQQVLNRDAAEPPTIEDAEGTPVPFEGPTVQIGRRLVVTGRKCLKPAAGGGRPGPVTVVSEGNTLTFTRPRHRNDRERQAREGTYRPESLEKVDGVWCRVFGPDNPFRNELEREDLAIACADIAAGITPTATYGAAETPIPPGAQRPVPGVWSTQEFAFVDETGVCEDILAGSA
jgi:hypothetical protein